VGREKRKNDERSFNNQFLQASRAGAARPATVVVLQQQQPQVAAAQLYNQQHQQNAPTIVQVQTVQTNQHIPQPIQYSATAPPVAYSTSIPVASPADVK